MTWVLVVLLLTSEQTPVEVRIGFPTQEACIKDAASITKKIKTYSGWAGAHVTNSECKAA
jgi:hypothetical protein